jgi:hypothetical protein
VRARYGRDQGQPQPASRLTRSPPTGETLERGCPYIFGETGPLIGDVQPEQLTIVADGQHDRAIAILQRVGDEVIQRLRCAVGITEQPAARRHVADHDVPAPCPGDGPGAGRRRLE